MSKTDELCNKNEEPCIKNEEFVLKNDELCSSGATEMATPEFARGLRTSWISH